MKNMYTILEYPPKLFLYGHEYIMFIYFFYFCLPDYPKSPSPLNIENEKSINFIKLLLSWCVICYFANCEVTYNVSIALSTKAKVVL